MNIREKYDPLSLSARVREKIEQKASGVRQADVGPVSAQHAGQYSSASKKMSPHQQQMKDDFMDLLFAANPQASDNSTDYAVNPQESEKRTDSAHASKSQDMLRIDQQGEDKKPSEDKSKPFSFTIQNTQLGEMKVSGELTNGEMLVFLEIPKPLDIRQQEILCQLLKPRLSKELGVPLQIKIGCPDH